MNPLILIGLAVAAFFLTKKDELKPRQRVLPPDPTVSRDEQLRSLFGDLDLAINEYKILTEVDGLGPDDPEVVEMLQIIDELEGLIAELDAAPAVGGGY